jgi:hypothetical protein
VAALMWQCSVMRCRANPSRWRAHQRLWRAGQRRAPAAVWFCGARQCARLCAGTLPATPKQHDVWGVDVIWTTAAPTASATCALYACGSKLTLSTTFCRAGALDEGIRHRGIVGICEHGCISSASCTVALEVRAPMPLETPHGTDGEQVDGAIPSSSHAPSQLLTMYSSTTACSAYCACRWRVSND